MKSSAVLDDIEEGEQTEITAQISLPVDGGWGWLVVFCSFSNIFILDGIAFTFGALLRDISKDLQKDDSVVALLNSIATAVYFLASPIASALINRYGFRECAMSGSMISSFALVFSYFATTFGALCFFYGGMAGFGYCLINMSSGLVVGFYFEKLRFLAVSVSACGSSLGVMILYPLNDYLVHVAGWRSTTLLHSGLLSLIFFLSMSFKPLISLTVTRTEDTATMYLPSVTNESSLSKTNDRRSGLTSSKTERLFKAVSNANFPTAAHLVDLGVRPLNVVDPGPSKINASTITIKSIGRKNMTATQLKQVQSLISKTSQNSININIDIPVENKSEKEKWWKRIFTWAPHSEHARPMYRDDAFFEGNVRNTDVYKRSVLGSTAETTGLEYQLAVSRAVAKKDLQDKKGIFTTSVRRVLATMMDPYLLRRYSFLILCLSGFLTYLGFLVPYVFLQDRDKEAGVDPKLCRFLMSIIGFSNAVGRLALGLLASKIDPLVLFSLSLTTAGLSTILSGLSYNINYQYAYCIIFGFCIAGVGCLRSLILVGIYGLDKLTNATGMMLIFLGFGNLFSTPIAGLVKTHFGYMVAFYISGMSIMLSGLVVIPVKSLAKREDNNARKKMFFI